jgi:hypothetical protein
MPISSAASNISGILLRNGSMTVVAPPFSNCRMPSRAIANRSDGDSSSAPRLVSGSSTV